MGVVFGRWICIDPIQYHPHLLIVCFTISILKLYFLAFKIISFNIINHIIFISTNTKCHRLQNVTVQ